MSSSIYSCDNVLYSGADEGIHVKEFTINRNNSNRSSLAVSTVENDNDSKGNTFMAFAVLSLIMLVLMLGTVGACVAFALEIHGLKSQTASIQNSMLQGTDLATHDLSLTYSSLEDKLEALNMSLHFGVWEAFVDKVRELNLSLSSQVIQNYEECTSRTREVNTSLSIQLNRNREKVLELNNSFVFAYEEVQQNYSLLDNRTLAILSSLNSGASNSSEPGSDAIVSSCAALPSSSPSGYYTVMASNGSAVRVYCNMTRSCGGVTGGWMRVAELDMTNSSHQCPSGLMLRTDSNLRTCVRDQELAGCSSLNNFASSVIPYSKVCGRIIGYQQFSTDAFYNPRNIDGPYVDGVSLTHGTPRQHIWSFAAAHDLRNNRANCPCINPLFSSETGALPPSFVGTDYFCATGTDDYNQNMFYTSNPLWDGAGCRSPNTCCVLNSPPWFYKQLPLTTDDIEVRVCRDEARTNEDVAIELIELFVQ